MKFSALRAGLALAILCSIPALAQAQQQYGIPPGDYTTQRSTPPDGTRIDVTYVVFPSANLTPSMISAINTAANIWNAAGANVQLVTTGAPSVIVFDSTGARIVSSTGVLGQYPDGTDYHHINFAALPVDGTQVWHTDPNTPALPGEIDLISYMLREFGFALGLGVDLGGLDPSSVMSLLPPGAGITNRTLSAGDIAALQTLYGAPEPATWALFGVGLAALGAAKKSRRRFSPAA